jgi:hypothetical protein
MSVILGKVLRTVYAGKALLSKEVKANSTESLWFQVDCLLFRPEAIYVAPEAVPHFSISMIYVGSRPQKPLTSPPTPAICFTRSTLGANMQYDTVPRGCFFTIVVTNNTDVDRVFKADIEGTATN